MRSLGLRLFLGVVGVLAPACARDGGAIIEVTPSSAEVDTIRLFIGTGDATSNATLGLPGPTANAMRTINGITYWGRDPGNELDVKTVAANQTATFVFVHSDTDTLGSVIAVGYAGNRIVEIASMFDVALPSSHYVRFPLALHAPASPPVTWGPEAGVVPSEAVCIGVAEPGQPAAYQVAFVVSPQDQDCDGFTPENGECNPDVWRGARAANLDEVTCLSPNPADLTCYLGGPQCIDGSPSAPGECAPSSYCTPATVCSRCNASLDCAKDVSPMAIPPARYECTVHIENGQLCNDELLLPSYPNAGIKCTDATIATAGARFDNHVDIGMASIYAKLRDPCEVSLLPMGKPPVGGSDKLGAMVAVELDNGHGVAIPVVLNIDRNTEGCGADLECTAEGALVDTQLTACAQALPKPTVVPGFPDGADDPTLTADMREIWFNVNDAEIWYANRASVLVAFGAPARVAQLESTIASVTTHSPHVSPDGLTMYLTSSRSPSAGGSDIFIAKRQNRTAPWSQPILISELSSTNVEGGASVDGAGLQMVIARRSDTGVQEFDLFVTSRGAATDAWDTPTLQTTISDPAVDDLNPHLTEDGLHVYFYRNVGNPGATEIFGADRMDLNAPFGAPHRIVQLSSLMNDTDPWVSPDGNTIYFASDRNGVSQIFIARR